MMPNPTDGPFFDDLEVGQVLEPAPDLTITDGMAAHYAAIVGDPYAPALSTPLSVRLTGGRRLANPALALHVSIGQSTVATRRVIANLFYRGVRLERAVEIGETLSTTVTINGLRETSRRPDRPPRGMALLGIRTISDRGDVVADYQRCALLPCRGPEPTGRADDLGSAELALDLEPFVARTPTAWDLSALPVGPQWAIGETRADPMSDTVTSAPELVRLTQNQAAVHRDHRLGAGGRRLVYGGHTIGLAQASLARLVPSLAHVVGWHSCDHVGPVFENDVLSFAHELVAEQEHGGGRVLAFRVTTRAQREGDSAEPTVLDWMPVVYAR
jgi:2-methylfumaryl-CoA hydratase